MTYPIQSFSIPRPGGAAQRVCRIQHLQRPPPLIPCRRTERVVVQQPQHGRVVMDGRVVEGATAIGGARLRGGAPAEQHLRRLVGVDASLLAPPFQSLPPCPVPPALLPSVPLPGASRPALSLDGRKDVKLVRVSVAGKELAPAEYELTEKLLTVKDLPAGEGLREGIRRVWGGGGGGGVGCFKAELLERYTMLPNV
jgi:hypothetical protein